MRFLQALRAAVPDAVVTKYNDRITSGIPDASLTWHGRTIWLEFKIRPKYGPITQRNKHAKLQQFSLWRYHVASDHRAFLLVFEPEDHISVYYIRDAQTLELIPVTTGSLPDILTFLLGCCENDAHV